MDKGIGFQELEFFARVKKRPGAFFGRKSLISLRDQVWGMLYAFRVCGRSEAMQHFCDFTEQYNRELLRADQNGYVCWWNHILYTSGNMDDMAFDSFFHQFEAYLQAKGLKLPDVE